MTKQVEKMAGSSTLGRQFRATQTWNILVLHLKENAVIKRRRNLKKRNECFTGANAVDVLHQFVKTRPEQFKNATSISRENMVRLCQSFLDMGIVSRIMENDVDKIDKFEDSSTALYVFIDDQESNATSNGRQVLREIDGDIRNSMDHISISSQNKRFISKHSSLTLRSKRRPHFPNFGAVSSHSSKESINQTDGEDADMKVQHPLKRTSTLVRRVVKRSSSDPNLQKSMHEASPSSENQTYKKKSSGARSSVRLRFSQRLSFRKKSFRKSERNRKNEQACVLANPLANEAFESEKPTEEENQKSGLSPEDLLRVQKECVRVRLLQKLDMPFVDDVIMSPITSDCTSKSDTITPFDNTHERLITSYNRDDFLVSTALNVLTHAPNSHETLTKIAKQDNECSKKIQLYFAVYDHYKSRTCSLLPTSMIDIMSEIIRTLETKPITESLEVVQLFLHLLPNELMKEVQDLITFLHCVMTSDDVVVSSRCSNKMLILQTFPGLIFPTDDKLTFCDVTSGPAGVLQFLLENIAHVFTLPTAITLAVERKQQLLENGQIDSPSLIRDSTCSLMISVDEFESQKVEFTQKQITELAKYVAADSTLLPSRKKKDFLKKLQSSHPSAYATLRQPLKASHQLFASSVESSKKLLKVPGTGTLTRRRSKNKGH